MKKRIENIKKQYWTEGKRIGAVLLGFVGGLGVAKGVDWLADQLPENLQGIVKNSKIPVLGVPGYLLASATTPDEWFAKHLGYGLTAAATYEGIKIIPVAQDILQGLGENMEKTYYTEGDNLQLGNFGFSELPVKSFELGEAAPIEVDLPDLNGAISLGYNGEQTKDVDNVRGLGYNGEQTKDVDKIQGLGYNGEQTKTQDDTPDLSGIL